MAITTVLFDLDGTLLPMDQESFIKAYLGGLCKKLAPLGYDPKALSAAIWKGTEAMVKNDGSRSNETIFWETFCGIFGEKAREDLPVFEDFYQNEFQQVAQACGYNPAAWQLIDGLKARGLRLVLATNPIFPAIATYSRVRWAGLTPEDFCHITTYENSRFCKPNPAYYRDILENLGLDPAECVMVGNDEGEDGAATALGLPVFLLTDCLICRPEVDTTGVPRGDYPALTQWLETM